MYIRLKSNVHTLGPKSEANPRTSASRDSTPGRRSSGLSGPQSCQSRHVALVSETHCPNGVAGAKRRLRAFTPLESGVKVKA